MSMALMIRVKALEDRVAALETLVTQLADSQALASSSEMTLGEAHRLYEGMRYQAQHRGKGRWLVTDTEMRETASDGWMDRSGAEALAEKLNSEVSVDA